MGTAFFITLMSVLITVLISQILINVISARIGKIKKINEKISKINEFFEFLLLTVFEPKNNSIYDKREQLIESYRLPLSSFFNIRSIELYNDSIYNMNFAIENIFQNEYDRIETVLKSIQEKDKYLFNLLSRKPQIDYFSSDVREIVQKKLKVLKNRKVILDEKIEFYESLNNFDRYIDIVFKAFCNHDEYSDESRKKIIIDKLRDRYSSELHNYNSIRNLYKIPLINKIERW